MNFKSISMLVATTALTFSLAHAQESLQTLNFKDGRVAQNLRGQKVSASVDGNMLVKALGLADGNTFRVVKTTTDKLNITHTNFQQYYKGVAVNGAVIMTHAKNGLLQSINGNYLDVSGISVNVSMDDLKATGVAQEAIGMKKVTRNYAPELQIIQSASGEHVMTYAIRLDGTDAKGMLLMKRVFVDAQSGKVQDIEELIAHTDVTANAHTFHSGERTITTDFDGVGTYTLYDSARKIRTMNATNAEMANSGADAFIDAKDYTNNSTEWLPKQAIMSTRLGTATNNIFTGLGQAVVPIAILGTPVAGDFENPSWPQLFFNNTTTPLRANGWFHFIEPGVSYSGAFLKANIFNGSATDTIIFPINTATSGTMLWSDTAGNEGRYTIDTVANPALDAHWGITKSYDYYIDKFNRNSYDGNGGRIINYMNGMFPMAYSQNNAAALQAPYNSMVYGLGDGINTNPFSALDVTGHEYTHLVISNNGNGGLRYRAESGALNESFADMFGASIVFYAKPDVANWRIGEEVYIGNGYMRSMSNPKSVYNPDTYQGEFWVSTANPNQNNDNGGVHTNSSVSNYWYYLLAEGGSGTNDNGYNYNFTGIGLASAEKIAYRTLTEYLSYNATFEEAFSTSLQATIDLFGSDTTKPEYVAVKNAWYAVGLGEGRTVAVKEVKVTNPNIDIYPNPVAANASFTIQSKLQQTVDATIFNTLGQPVQTLKIKNGSNNVTTGGLAAGIYNISFNVAGKQYVHKVTVF